MQEMKRLGLKEDSKSGDLRQSSAAEQREPAALEAEETASGSSPGPDACLVAAEDDSKVGLLPGQINTPLPGGCFPLSFSAISPESTNRSLPKFQYLTDDHFDTLRPKQNSLALIVRP